MSKLLIILRALGELAVLAAFFFALLTFLVVALPPA
jgi:hypothetical protein